MLLSLLSAAAAVAPTPPAPQPIDIGSWFTASDYPPAARRQGAEGAVGYRIDVDAAGRPVGCQVTQSAGPALDQPTCDLLIRRSHFRPAVDASGRGVAALGSSRLCRERAGGRRLVGAGWCEVAAGGLGGRRPSTSKSESWALPSCASIIRAIQLL